MGEPAGLPAGLSNLDGRRPPAVRGVESPIAAGLTARMHVVLGHLPAAVPLTLSELA